MKNDEAEDIVIVAPAKDTPNTWFIFREFGEEITVKLINGYWRCNRILTQKELDYLNNNISKND